MILHRQANDLKFANFNVTFLQRERITQVCKFAPSEITSNVLFFIGGNYFGEANPYPHVGPKYFR